MKPLSVQRLGAILAAVLALGAIFGANPASAAVRDDGPITGFSASVDKKTAAPGDDLTLTLSLTNTETIPIVFAYEYIEPNWPTSSYRNAFAITGCGGDQTDCTVAPSGDFVSFHPTAPIPPGATRTVTATVRIVSPLPWSVPLRLNWTPYAYAEYGYPAVMTKSGPHLNGTPELETVIS
ncbi:hypothetical protein AB0E96_13945 [Kitasatospora sp. NPDC036755]|uniref:hypothetical protein n=1 Tax=Kitasatospora sp. NPDC036755 TaxID=3154600 RepID=UPI0033C05E8F